MEKEAIAALLEEKYEALLEYFSNQEDEKWELGPNEKWTSGQQALHLLQSIKPLNTAMSLPKFIVKARFGTTNRSVRSYEEVINRYQERLKEAHGATYGPSENMKVPKLKEKDYLINRLRTEYKKLQYKTLKRWSDEQLDNLILPHPLMGKMPVREIVMWSAYHAEHHTKTLVENY